MRWTVWGSNPGEERFSAVVRTGFGANPAFYTMGTGSVPGDKRPERGADHLPTQMAARLKKVQIYTYFCSVVGRTVYLFTFM
jgi:hypothetical protein